MLDGWIVHGMSPQPPLNLLIQCMQAVTWEDLIPHTTEAGRAVLRDALIYPAEAMRLVEELGYRTPEDLEVWESVD